jgi:hypothetical protein
MMRKDGGDSDANPIHLQGDTATEFRALISMTGVSGHSLNHTHSEFLRL